MKIIYAGVIDDALKEYSETLLTLRAKLDRMLDRSPIAAEVLATYGRLQHSITQHGTFDVRTQEAIALVVAAVEDCWECHFTRTVACHAVGWTRAEAVALRTGQPIPYAEQTTALLAVARQAAKRTCEVDEDTWQGALWAGWTIEELAELFTHVIVNIFTNYFNHSAGTHYAGADVDIPVGHDLKDAVA